MATIVLLLCFAMACGSIDSKPSVTDPDTLPLESRVRARIAGLDAKASLYAKHLPSGRQIAIQADEPMNSVSVIKIAIMVLAYRDAENGQLNLKERYLLRPQDKRRGSGVLRAFAPGLQPTYRDLITQMIISSDNTATDIVINKVGLERVNDMLETLVYQQL